MIKLLIAPTKTVPIYDHGRYDVVFAKIDPIHIPTLDLAIGYVLSPNAQLPRGHDTLPRNCRRERHFEDFDRKMFFSDHKGLLKNNCWFIFDKFTYTLVSSRGQDLFCK